ncbi:MAG: hypothetical protein WC686_02370 [Candidatus Shapirobacteria bacterium]|jgi:hypothetical protein
MSFFKEFDQKPFEYLSLLLILLIGAVLFVSFAFNPSSQRRVIYLTSAFYFFWSLYHHYRRGDLHLSIVVEYLVIIFFALVLLGSTIL